MNQKTIYGVFSALLLMVAMFFTACADELGTNNDTLQAEVENMDGLTCFTTEGPEDTRTSIDKEGKFRWTKGDTIYIYKDNEWIKSDSIEIVEDGKRAKFYFKGVFKENEYPVLFSGSATAATIPTEQVQSAGNNSNHLGSAGDCGVAIATKQGSGRYSFNLTHQMSYLMFEPKVANAGDEIVVRRIKVTEISSPSKNISGAFAFSLDADNKPVIDYAASGGSNEITVLCGSDVLPVENGDMEASEATNYGFIVDNANYDVYDTDNNKRIYMVIRPGENYNFKIEYEVSSTTDYEEVSFHESINGSSVQWHPIPRGYTEIQSRTPSANLTFKPNHYYIFRHKLTVPKPKEENLFRYGFDQYYMWGASRWFWDGATTYPVAADGSQSEDQPTPTPDKDSREDSRWYGSATYASTYPGGLNDDGKHAQANMGIWAGENVLTANQMSFYVVYGDPHYDNTKPWVLSSYVGKHGSAPLICYGGVWFKKKAKIIEDEGVSWPNSTQEGNASNRYSAPFQTNDPNGQKDINRTFNLRFNAPPVNYRVVYKNKAAHDADPEKKWLRPWVLDPNKDSLDYFFVPCLGRIEYDHGVTTLGTGDPTLTLVGGQGYYWTKTPVRGNEGSTHWYVDGDNGYDNAFYLQIHYEYVALSWQMRSIYMKTGMIPARTSGGPGVVVFE